MVDRKLFKEYLGSKMDSGLCRTHKITRAVLRAPLKAKKRLPAKWTEPAHNEPILQLTTGANRLGHEVGRWCLGKIFSPCCFWLKFLCH